MDEIAGQHSVEALLLPGGDGPRFAPIPVSHLDAAAADAKAFLTCAGVSAGDVVLLVADASRSALLRPFTQALTELSCPYVAAENARFTRGNLLDFFSLFAFRAVLALHGAVAGMIAEQGKDPLALFGEAAVYATDAATSYAAEPSSARGWWDLGAAIAVGCGDANRSRGHLIRGRLEIEQQASGLLGLRAGWNGQLLAPAIPARLLDGGCDCRLDLPLLEFHVEPNGASR